MQTEYNEYKVIRPFIFPKIYDTIYNLHRRFLCPHFQRVCLANVGILILSLTVLLLDFSNAQYLKSVSGRVLKLYKHIYQHANLCIWVLLWCRSGGIHVLWTHLFFAYNFSKHQTVLFFCDFCLFVAFFLVNCIFEAFILNSNVHYVSENKSQTKVTGSFVIKAPAR